VMMPGAFDDVEDVLMAADAYALPSYEEGMSLSLLEAMAARLPVVASDIVGNRAIVTHGENGWLVPVKQIKPLADTIVKLVQPSPNFDRITDAARSLVTQHYSVTQTATNFLHLFEQILAK